MRINDYFNNSSKILTGLLVKCNFIFLDVFYLKMLYKLILKEKLDLHNPKTFNEKLQWLKLYDRNPIYTNMVDKFEAKNFVKNLIGCKYIIPTIGIYNCFDDIDFNTLPNKFVIKCTHDSGCTIVCNDKSKLDISLVKKNINKSLKKNYYYKFREWPYKNIKPRIIIEKYMGNNLVDYKIQCFNGTPDNTLVCEGRNSTTGVKYYYFDNDWNYLNYCSSSKSSIFKYNIKKPVNYDEMLKIAKIISKGYPEMRVDLYNIDGKIYFGEITFFSNAGFDYTISREADIILGRKLILPNTIIK